MTTLTPEQLERLQRYLRIDGDGNVVGDGNHVRVVKQTAEGAHIVQIGAAQITLAIGPQREVLVNGGQVGVIGDGNIIFGGINYTIYPQVRAQKLDPEVLAQAQQRLEAMPLDTVPDPAPLPHGSRMPFARNDLFVGRERDLQDLARALKGGQTTAIGQIAVATGLGGIGKTQLASEFVHRYGPYFAGGVFWLSFADPAGVPTEIADCGKAGYLDLRPDFGNLPLDDQVRLVLGAWSNGLPRLLVFDNCEDEGLLGRWRPSSGAAWVLVTSRRRMWRAELGVHCLPLDVLERTEVKP